MIDPRWVFIEPQELYSPRNPIWIGKHFVFHVENQIKLFRKLERSIRENSSWNKINRKRRNDFWSLGTDVMEIYSFHHRMDESIVKGETTFEFLQYICDGNLWDFFFILLLVGKGLTIFLFWYDINYLDFPLVKNFDLWLIRLKTGSL